MKDSQEPQIAVNPDSLMDNLLLSHETSGTDQKDSTNSLGSDSTVESPSASSPTCLGIPRMEITDNKDSDKTVTTEVKDIPNTDGLSVEEICKLAEDAKIIGNDYFKAGDYNLALIQYDKAIDILLKSNESTNKSIHIYYCNKAFCNLKLENYGSAIEDASTAITYQPKFYKAYYRRGCANFCLGKYQLALDDFYLIAVISPDPALRSRFNQCKSIVMKQKFAEAISNEKSIPPSETVHPENMIVESDYKGPVYNPENLSVQFLNDLIEYIKVPGNVLHIRYAYLIVMDMINLLKKLNTMVRIEVPQGHEITICGDVHGQFYDLLNIFEINGLPSVENPYLFNGDFVDRGIYSVECILTLMTAKLIFPNHVHLARGNHETNSMNSLYGFQGEVFHKYDQKLYLLFSECFCALPLAHLINEKIFVVHGGLFNRDNVTLKEIDSINRFCEPQESGLMAEMLWSDPQPSNGRKPSKRGIACEFGPDVTENFLKTNDLKMIIRSHEMKRDGFHLEHGGKLVTVFSAPNYCDHVGNDGAYIRIGADLKPNYFKFSAVAHPEGRAMQFANPIVGMIQKEGSYNPND